MLADFKRHIEAHYGERLVEVVLYGSVARGEATPESDVDVLVVLRGPVDHYHESKHLAKIVVDLMAQSGEFITPVVLSEKEYQSADWPLLRNVRAEGISL